MKIQFLNHFKLVAALFLVCAPPLNAAEHWIHLTTPHFEMYTTNGEKQATAALAVFEQVRYFFLQNSKSKSAPDAQVQIIAFRSDKEYKPYRINEGSFAYYLRSRKVDYIVMQDISSEHYEAAVHEYTHLVAEHLNLNLPLWFNEGLADVYSSLESQGNKAVVGRPLAGRTMVLRTQPWLDLPALFSVGQDSPYYNQSDKMSIFYAQSWALTHMLALGKDYTAGFAKFLTAVGSGKPMAECFQSVYGKTLVQVNEDLHRYVNQATVRAAVFDVKLPKSDLEPEVSDASPFSVDLALANLLASRKSTMAEASDRLAKLAADHPESAEVHESLGYLAWYQGDRLKARDCFKLAVEQGSKNTQMLMQYAQLLHESGAPPEQILPVLQKVVEIKPDGADGWLNLGLTEAAAGHYKAALDALAHLKSVSPEHAYALFSTQALCYLKMKAPAVARSTAERAKQFAATADEQYRISNLMRALDAEAQGGNAASPELAVEAYPAAVEAGRPGLMKSRNADRPRDVPSIIRRGEIRHVESVTKFLECNANSHRLHVMVDAKEMVFELDDPSDIIVRNKPGGIIDFQCGAQKPVNLGIFYAPSAAPATADGTIRELVF